MKKRTSRILSLTLLCAMVLGLLAGCADRFIELEEVQPEGKKRMAAADFLNGFRPGRDERFL